MQNIRALQQAQEEQDAQMQASTEAMLASRQAEAERQDERDEHQRELLKLHREAANRETERDAENERRAEVEATRKRNELYRWLFTTLIAITGVAIAIVALATRQ